MTDQIDALIPAPWPSRRRLLVATGALALLAGAFVLNGSGLLGPRLEHTPNWGSDVEVTREGTLLAERLALIVNEGVVPVEVQELTLPPIDGLIWLGVDGIPTTLAPQESFELAVRFEVRDCALDVNGFDTFPLLASSGIAPARTVDVAAPLSHEPALRADWAGADAGDGLPASWAGQPASWVLDTIAPACLGFDAAGSSSTDTAGR